MARIEDGLILTYGSAFRPVLEERDRQDEQWGVQNHHPAYWLAILGKQVGQLGAAVLDREWAANVDAGTATVREEAVQVAAVAIALIECIDRGEMPVGLTTAKPDDKRLLSRVLGRDDESLHGQETLQKTCYHCNLLIEFDADDNAYHHADEDAYADWLHAHRLTTGNHAARWEPPCLICGRDNANGTHDALQMGGHLNHNYTRASM